MPQRSNEFQELVTLIQQALSPVGAKVTASAMMDVPGQSSQREIDVLIESGVGPYSIKIAVEAKDEGRKMDQTKFEALIAKYFSERSIKVNKLVVITHRGFYDSVIERAAAFGPQIELLTYNKIYDTDWAQLYPQTIAFRIAPHLCSITIKPTIQGYDPKKLQKEGHVRCFHGTDYGTVEQYVVNEFHKRVLPERPTLFQELEARAQQEPNGQALATITLKPNVNHPVSLYIEDKGYLIDAITFTIHVVSDKGQVKYSGCQIQSSNGESSIVPLAEAIVGGKRLVFVLPSPNNPQRMIVKIDDAPSHTHEPSKNDKSSEREARNDS